MMPATARIAMIGAMRRHASGIGSATRRTKPYVPSFSSTAASIIEPAVGAAV